MTASKHSSIAACVIALASCGRLHFDARDDGRGVGDGDDRDGVPADVALDNLGQRAYIKASNPDANDQFGKAIALSHDGSTLVVGSSDSSNSPGIDGNQADNSDSRAGAVYVFVRAGATWSQQAYIKASNPDAFDFFGATVTLSGDGNTLAVGAFQESSAASGIDGNQADNSASDAGAAYVFTRTAGTWTQQAYIKASNAATNMGFGASIALAADGDTLAVGATEERSDATGVNGNQADTSLVLAGAVYVFMRTGVTWSQQAYVKPSNTRSNMFFGGGVGLSADGSVLAVGAPYESSSASGIDGDAADQGAPNAGAVYVFTRAGTTWSQETYIKSSNTYTDEFFGSGLVLSSDGSTLVTGTNVEHSAATGINGNENDASAMNAGAAFGFRHVGSTWIQEAYFKASNTDANDGFGPSLGISDDGSTLAIGAIGEASAATGIDGDQTDNSAVQAGACYVFQRAGSTWQQRWYVKASNTEAGDTFGETVVLSGDASTLAVGANWESSAASGIDGNQADNSDSRAGAVYVFR